ncbi:DUF721 domain-containing protein [Ruegeria arenilitoris]|uniref:DUF721 domain-containing protein n=1 Tax=Ruegeria arenilitoris TaxID=1173585 RepID=UPI00147E29C9|nr:DciA family protein [Ruegeria arenilitoris]
MQSRRSSTRGFKRTATLLNDQIRRAGESRGFAVSRLLTHWAEIVGQDIAAIARPVKVGYGNGNFGATLTVLTTGPQAPILDMQKEQIRERVNAVYGFSAITNIRITQTAPTGFADGQASFDHKPKQENPEIAPEIAAEADKVSRDVNDVDLRAALERLGRNVLSKQKH